MWLSFVKAMNLLLFLVDWDWVTTTEIFDKSYMIHPLANEIHKYKSCICGMVRLKQTEQLSEGTNI